LRLFEALAQWLLAQHGDPGCETGLYYLKMRFRRSGHDYSVGLGGQGIPNRRIHRNVAPHFWSSLNDGHQLS
jgi:hypothetical protein